MDSQRVLLWSPNPGAQASFCQATTNEVLYGGAAGGGKSAALIAIALCWVHNPRYRALILRRETTQLNDLLDKARALYPKLGGKENLTTKTWRFPSGATIRFNHCEHESDALIYDGQEFQFVGFDELTHFTEKQYRAIRARIRSSDPTLPRYTRATTNPGGPGHDWVFRRFGAWLDPTYGARALPQEVRWFIADDEVTADTPGALSRVFIPASLADNPHLTRNDPNYASQLADLDPVRRAQLLGGDWLVKPAAGLYFKRAWFETVDASPAQARRCRYWDRGATTDGDWTIGVRLADSRDGLYWVEDVIRMRGRPAEVMAAIKAAAEADGPNCPQVLEQDPGQAGVAEVDHYVAQLAGHHVRSVKPTGDKVTRAQPVSAQCERRNVKLVRGAWNGPFLDVLEAFPEGDHDDDVDALSGAFTYLHKVPAPYKPAAAGKSRWAR